MASNSQIYILDEDCLDLTKSQKTEKGDSPVRPMVIANSSSEDDDRPVVKRKRATRRPKRRGSSDCKENISCGIYSTAVNECYKKIESGIDRLSSDEEEKSNDNNNNNNNNNNEAEEQTKLKEKKRQKRKSPRKAAEESPGLMSPTCLDTSDVVVRGPSPPPAPGVVHRKRGVRRPKAVKQALAEIQALKRTMPLLMDSGLNNSFADSSLDSSLITQDDDITVKIRTKFGIERYTMKYHDTFRGLFEKMAAKEGVSPDQCIMFREDDNIEPYMTPASAKVTVADIIGFCVRAELDEEEDKVISGEDESSIKLQVQANGLKHKMKFSMLKTETLLKLMIEFARQQNRELNTLKFFFDGELVKESDTPEDLDMEEMECLDVQFL